MSEQTRQPITLDDARLWVQQNSAILAVKTRSNPVEFGAVIGLFVMLLLVSIFAGKREELVKALPSLQAIDSLLRPDAFIRDVRRADDTSVSPALRNNFDCLQRSGDWCD